MDYNKREQIPLKDKNKYERVGCNERRYAADTQEMEPKGMEIRTVVMTRKELLESGGRSVSYSGRCLRRSV